MGTCFLATKESSVSPMHKAMIIDSGIDDIHLTSLVTGLPTNLLRAALRKHDLDPGTFGVDKRGVVSEQLSVEGALTGDEPPDVLHYSAQDPVFPQQSTADQFFDEPQFESYRRLGVHIVERICAEQGSSSLDLQQFVEAAKKYVAGTKP